MAQPTTYGISLLRAMSADVMPYFRSFLTTLMPVETEEVPTAAVDKYARVYWNRSFFASLTVDEGAFVVAHEMMHLWLNHAARAKSLGVTDFQVWNVATDCEINRTLVLMKLACPKSACLPEKFGLPVDGKAEEYYIALLQQKQQQQQKQQGKNGQGQGNPSPGQGPSGNNQSGQTPGSGQGSTSVVNGGGPDVHGSAVGDKPGPWEKPGDDPATGTRSTVDVQIAKEQCAKDIADMSSKGKGNIPAGLLRQAKDILEPARVTWEKYLHAAVSMACNTTYGYDERTYRRISPTSFSMGGDILLPSTETYRPTIACVLDTSGSMSSADLSEGLREIQGVCHTLDAPITVYTVDTEASEPQIVTRASDVKLTGGGGTDMSYGIQFAYDRAREKPHIIIVLTDGYTGWPSAPPTPATKVIIVVTSNGGTTDGCPAWATSIKMDK